MTYLLATAVIWGFALVAQRTASFHLGPFLFNGIRFLLGAAVLLPLLWSARRRGRRSCTQEVLPWSVMGACIGVGVVLFAAANLQQAGLATTTAGKAGFITGLYVIIVPLLGLLQGHRIQPHLWLGVLLAAAGLYLLTMSGGFEMQWGDGLMLLGAFGWGVHVRMVGWLSTRVRSIVLAAIQFTVCGVLSLLTSFAVERTAGSDLLAASWALAYAGLLSVGLGYTLQIVGQRRVQPSRAGIILSSEALFAALAGWILLQETMTGRMLVGCGFIAAGIILAQIHRRRSCELA